MKTRWIPMTGATAPRSVKEDILEKIRELIEWYEENATRIEDDYIIANLRLVLGLAASVEDLDNTIFIEKIAETVIDIIKKQRELIQELENEVYLRTSRHPS